MLYALLDLLLPGALRDKAKAVVAVLGAVLASLVSLYDQPALTAIVTVLTALGVYAVPNASLAQRGVTDGSDR